jgi:GNAT superfamily N-acetyltransferase
MDEITRKWFDASSVRVCRAPELQGWHSDEELARLSGAPRASELHVEPTDGGKIELRVVNQDLLCEPIVRNVAQVAHEGYVFEIQNKAFVLRQQFRGMGIGPRSVAIELHEAQRLKYFSKVVVNAVGDWHHRSGAFAMNGYYVWAKMGFNAVLPLSFRDHPSLPVACKGCRDVADLFSTVEGRDFWLRHGSTLDLEFPLEEASLSWKRFRRYAQERHIEVVP